MNGTKPRAFALFVFIICSAMIFVACAPIDSIVGFFANDGTGHIFKFALASNPANLDPQLASDESSITISKNLFAGLMGYDQNGRLTGRIAKDYSISEDGLTYTFYLEEGYSWHAVGDFEAPLTAHDFVFGFRRLMDPKTASPHSEKYFCISGAALARKGVTEPSEIGVTALDDYTVQFTLEYRNAEFLYLLAELPAMPCCEEFFNTAGGKYGLEAEAVCSNGPFYVRYWLHDPYGKNNYVRLRRNPGYSSVSYVSPAGINYLITPDVGERVTDFRDGSTEALLYPAGRAADIDGVKYLSGYADCVGLVFNEKIKAFSDYDVRQIFSWGIDREALCSSAPDILKPAYSLIPNCTAISSRGYSSQVASEVTESNRAMSEYKWSFALSDSEKSGLIGMTVMVPSGFEYSDYLSELVDSWYSVFRIHFAIEIVTDSDYASRIKSGDYEIALVSLHGDTASPFDYLRPFGSDSTYGISLSEVKSVEYEQGRYASMTAMNYACSEAENAIVSEYHFIPLWYVPTLCCYDEDVEDLWLDPFSGTVYFENAKKF